MFHFGLSEVLQPSIILSQVNAHISLHESACDIPAAMLTSHLQMQELLSVPIKHELGSKSRNSFNTHGHLLSMTTI